MALAIAIFSLLSFLFTRGEILGHSSFETAIGERAAPDGGSSLLDGGGRYADTNGRTFIQDNLWSTATTQYAVWVGRRGEPLVGKRARGADRWTVSDLSEITGNPLDAPTIDDEHNVYAIAVDARGYVHVAGNMHSDPLHYVRSTAPGDITAWQAATMPTASEQVTYPAFVGLPDGTLLFVRREGVAGDGSITVDRLLPGEDDWRPIGVILSGADKESPYLHRIAAEPATGVIHVLFSWRGRGGASAANDVGYMRSKTGGVTWETSNGRQLPLPVVHETAEVVVDTAANGSGLINSGGMTVDACGDPHGMVVFHRSSGHRELYHLWHDGAAWHRERVHGRLLTGRPAMAATPDGRVWAIGMQKGWIRAIDLTPGARRRDHHDLARAPEGWEVTYDGNALARHGRLEILLPSGSDPNVVRADLADSQGQRRPAGCRQRTGGKE